MSMGRAFGLHLGLCLGLLSSSALAETFPSLLGRQLGEAEHLAKEAGLEVVVQKVDSLERRGKVLLQIPAGGTDVGTDRRIYLQASDGIVVPDLTAKPLADAQGALKSMGLASASSDRRHDGLVRGTVASQVPRPKERIDATRQIVFLDIVGGRYVAVPDVNGKLLSDALAAIRNGELVATESPTNESFAKTSVQESRLNCKTVRINKAIVSSTQPAAGTEIYPGQSVVVNWSVQPSDRDQASDAEECRPPPIDRDICGRRHQFC
ncbi:PASTA domain-containing protein [Sinorhizobium medicae]|nr:PASTA domain-containing protein [Sinorhizobium medicae]